MRTVGSDAVGDECKSKTCFRFTETTPGVVGKRSEPTNPAGPAMMSVGIAQKSRFGPSVRILLVQPESE